MYRLVAPLLFFLFLTSCKDKTFENEVRRMIGLEVTIPEFESGVYAGADTTANLLADAPAKMIIFYDSTECSSCKMSRIWEWQDIVAFSKGTRQKFVPVFIFSPTGGGERQLMHSLRMDPLDCMVYIDKAQRFPAANPDIPEDKRLHTFLLDGSNRIVLVGNPTGNDTLWELYKSTIRQLIDNNGELTAEL